VTGNGIAIAQILFRYKGKYGCGWTCCDCGICYWICLMVCCCICWLDSVTCWWVCWTGCCWTCCESTGQMIDHLLKCFLQVCHTTLAQLTQHPYPLKGKITWVSHGINCSNTSVHHKRISLFNAWMNYTICLGAIICNRRSMDFAFDVIASFGVVLYCFSCTPISPFHLLGLSTDWKQAWHKANGITPYLSIKNLP